MPTKEENELLTQTGPGTPGGEFMRRYWQPAALSEELVPGGPPVPVQLLGEHLVLFRDGQGRLGLLGRYCSHRGTDLCGGEAEEAGLRCSYHGWLYDVHGRCLEQPLEPPESTFHETIRHPAYPCQEKAGIIFAYLGPGDPPLLPAYEFLTVPDDQRRATKYFQECNYLQATEGSLDPVQLLVFKRLLISSADSDGGPTLIVEPEDTDAGTRVTTVRAVDADAVAVEIRNFMLPSLCSLPGIGMDGYTVHWHVPTDDTHHWRYVIGFRRDGPMTDDDAKRNGVEMAPGYRLNRDEVLRCLREGQPVDSYVAYATVMAEAQGPIYDRTRENLGDSDRGILSMRNAIYRGIEDVKEGADPLHVVRDPARNDFSHIVAREDVLPADADWRSHGRE